MLDGFLRRPQPGDILRERLVDRSLGEKRAEALAIDLHAALWLLPQRAKSGHGAAAHGDRELIARLRPSEDLSDVVAQLALRYGLVRHSCYAL